MTNETDELGREMARVITDIERMEAEAGCELPDLNAAGGATLTQRAQRLLDCDDPPTGRDLETCRRVAGLE
jgi:hypothetical protein